MENNGTKVVVEPPDSRGLRRISVSGATVGSAWSLRGMRRILWRLGYPKDIDVRDHPSVSWRGGGSETWPDHTWRRRVTSTLLIAGLLGSMVLLVRIGIPDAFGALTFSQRLTGFLFILSGAVAGVAALAVLDYWGKRRSKYTGGVVLLGVLIALATTSLLLFMWLQEREYTPYLLMYLPLWFWSLWALWLLLRQKAWRGIPQPHRFAAGAAATALLATVNLAYSAVYQPNSTPALLKLTAQFGTPRPDPVRSIVHLPLTLHVQNVGKVATYIINDDYSVYGYSAKSTKVKGGLKGRKEAMEGRFDAQLHAGTPVSQTISAGRFHSPGSWLEPGEEYKKEKVIRIPKNAKYDWVEVYFGMEAMRKDRGRIDDEFLIEHQSWDEEDGMVYCPPEACGDLLFSSHRGRLRHNNNIINVTRRPVYVTAEWWLDKEDSSMTTSMSSSADFIPEDEAAAIRAQEESEREKERYGVFYVDTSTAVPFATLLKTPAS
ncbi:hypothetical protein ACFV9D_02655 [Streptomyces sp. NPDC059875]|uniref:hypothetical protein n=1 Tax=unclassified Streptomyces TaxID=2593676 RepID=UPI0036656826